MNSGQWLYVSKKELRGFADERRRVKHDKKIFFGEKN